MLCCRDAGVLAFFKVTLKAILGINTQPANDGRGSRGLRGKFYGPSLEVGYLTSAHSYHAIITAGNSGKDILSMGPRERETGCINSGQSLPQRLPSTIWLPSCLPPNLTLPAPYIPFEMPKREERREAEALESSIKFNLRAK